MEYSSEDMDRIMSASKLGQSDVARLLGVSRITVYNWLKGGEPHKLLRTKVYKLFGALDRATEAGDLPILDRKLDERNTKLVAIVRRHL